MTQPQTSKSRVPIVIAFTALTLITLMFLVYALVQRTEALKMHEVNKEIEKRLLHAEDRLKSCENSK